MVRAPSFSPTATFSGGWRPRSPGCARPSSTSSGSTCRIGAPRSARCLPSTFASPAYAKRVLEIIRRMDQNLEDVGSLLGEIERGRRDREILDEVEQV